MLHRGDDGGEPVERNGVGFNKIDYPIVRRILTAIDATGQITPQQHGVLGRTLRRYHRQLGELGITLFDQNHDQVSQAPPAPAPRRLVALPRTEPTPPPAHPADDDPPVPIDDAELGDDEIDGAAIPPMADILGEGGIIARALPGYEPRPAQIEVAQAIADAIVSQEHILAEAGTGTGKSLAYLIPAIYSRKRTIVSTEGKALQDQLSKKDLPFLASVLPVAFSYTVLKGISNYVCRLKWDEEAGKQQMLGSAEFETLSGWVHETETGDLAEAPLSPSAELRDHITSDSHECLGKECPYAVQCFALQAKARAQVSDVVVVNHTLLTLDIALRQRTDDGVSILPDRKLIVVDEAHSLEDVATKAFTAEITNWTVPAALRGKLPELAGLEEHEIERVTRAAQGFFAGLDRDERQTYVVTPAPELQMVARSVAGELRSLARTARARKLGQDFASFEPIPAQRLAGTEQIRVERYARRLVELGDVFLTVAAPPSDADVLYVEKSTSSRGNRTIAIKRAPISVADDLAEALWEKWPVVATSATLSTHGTFDYFRERCGCEDGRSVIVDSPFDFRRNALLYLPQNGALYDPSRYYQDGSVEYFDRLGGLIEELLLASDGRAFCLFTSRRAMDEVYRRIAHRLRWQVLKQGDASPNELIRRFKADGHAVLFGLRTFWAGVDVQGEALSMVVIDKLPFPTPDEPVYQARCDLLVKQSGDKWAWFKRLALPTCAIQFKQGFGRLIRTKRDRGVVALLDGRLTIKGYGTGIIRSLPPATQVRTLAEVRSFFATGEVPYRQETLL